MAGSLDPRPEASGRSGADRPAAEATPLEQDLRALAVLCVEDDAATLRLLESMLRPLVGSLAVARDGASGLAAFQDRPAQIVVTDLRMPALDGPAMARAIRAMDGTVQVIMLTDATDAASLTRSIDAGVDQYVLKPVQQERLVVALLACVYRRRTRPAAAPAAAPSDRERAQLAQLTPREREILVRIGQGLPTRAIAEGLGISPKTVQAHLAHLMAKLDLHKATALAAFAIRTGLR